MEQTKNYIRCKGDRAEGGMERQQIVVENTGLYPLERAPVLRASPRLAPVLLVGEYPHGAKAAAAKRLLQRALVDAGLDEDRLQLAPIGPRLAADRARLSPLLVVALGAAAAEALLGRAVRLTLERGRIQALSDGTRILVTESPAAVLGLADSVARGREYRRLVNELLYAVPYQRRPC